MNDTSHLPDTRGPESETSRQFPQEKDFFLLLQQHDADSWDLVLSIYAPQLRRDIQSSLTRRNLGVEWLDDLEQETWLTVVRQIGNFVWESETKFYHWFRSIATFHVRNLERKLRHPYVSLEEIDQDVDATGLSLDFFLYTHGLIEDSAEARVALRESVEILTHAMQSLKPREREILLRRLLYNESIQILATEYEVKPETISVMLVRAKQSIRQYIDSLK